MVVHEQWAYGGNSRIDLNQTQSIYTWYRDAAIGNKDIQWEVVKKLNIGVDYSLFEGMLAGSLDSSVTNVLIYLFMVETVPFPLISEELHLLLIKVRSVRMDMNWNYV